MVGDSKGDLDRLLLLGVSQGSAGPELQEQLYQLEPQLPRLLAELAAVQPRVAMVIVTCERLEFLVAGGADVSAQALAQLMARVTGLPIGRRMRVEVYRKLAFELVIFTYFLGRPILGESWWPGPPLLSAASHAAPARPSTGT